MKWLKLLVLYVGLDFDVYSRIAVFKIITDKIQALKDLGYSPDDLKSIRLEIVDNLDKLAKSVEKDELNSLVVELVNPEVHLGWRANSNGGGNWGGLKLVATDIKFIGA